MFKTFREAVEAVKALSTQARLLNLSIIEHIELSKGGDGLAERVHALEDERRNWEAEIQALLLKAGGTLQAANNAESRSRTMLRHAEKFSAEFDSDGEGAFPPEGYELPQGNADFGQQEAVQAMPVGVAITGKENAMRRKFS